MYKLHLHQGEVSGQVHHILANTCLFSSLKTNRQTKKTLLILSLLLTCSQYEKSRKKSTRHDQIRCKNHSVKHKWKAKNSFIYITKVTQMYGYDNFKRITCKTILLLSKK